MRDNVRLQRGDVLGAVVVQGVVPNCIQSSELSTQYFIWKKNNWILRLATCLTCFTRLNCLICLILTWVLARIFTCLTWLICITCFIWLTWLTYLNCLNLFSLSYSDFCTDSYLESVTYFYLSYLSCLFYLSYLKKYFI